MSAALLAAVALLAASPPSGPGELIDARGIQLLVGHTEAPPPNADPRPRVHLEHWVGAVLQSRPLDGEAVSHGRFLDDQRLVLTLPSGALVVLELAARTRTTVDHGVRGAAGSTPDGQTLVYLRGEMPRYEVWRADDGAAPRPVTTDLAPAWAPAVSPDGRVVVFVSAVTGVPALWRVVDDGAPEQLTNVGARSEPGVVPALDPFPVGRGAPLVLGDRLVFEGQGGVFVADLEGRTVEAVPGVRTPHWLRPGALVAVERAGWLEPLVLDPEPAP